VEPVRGPTRPGRPRDPSIAASVLDAVLAVLADGGYGALTLERVARQAGTTKPAIYRRWRGRQRLVLAALRTRMGEVTAPDTGCTLCDIGECLLVFLAAFRRLPPDVLGPLFADCAGDPDLHRAFMTTLFDPPRAAVAVTLDRAHERGDLRAGVDRNLVVDLLGSLIHYRLLFRHAATSDDEIGHIVEALMRGVAADYPGLIEHSRRLRSATAHHPHP
jgi:AcrR family transcriptional regulator